MNEDNVMEPTYKLSDALRKAYALSNTIISMECFLNDIEGDFSDAFALSELCNSELGKAVVLHEECEIIINRLSSPQKGDPLPGELLLSLMTLIAKSPKDESWGKNAAYLGSDLAKYALLDPSYRPTVELLAELGRGRGFNMQVAWDKADHWGVIYRGKTNTGRESQCA